MKNLVRLSSIIPNSLVNGPGMRKVIYAQGCKHNCKGCFNTHTHSFDLGLMWDINDLVRTVINDPIIRGVTFSGGDPLEQPEEFGIIAKKIKTAKPKLNIWCYTGYTIEYILDHLNKYKLLLENIDVLVDGKYDETQPDNTKSFRGSLNQRFIDVQKTLKEKKIYEYTL